MRHARLFLIVLLLACLPRELTAADWPQWGGTDNRNLVSEEAGLPDSFVPGRKGGSSDGIDPATTENVRWVVKLGSNCYGNPTVARGRVFVGTDDFLVAEDPRFTRTRGGIVHCLDEATGETLWRLVTPARKDVRPDAHFGFQHLGVCSSPTVDGDRVYVVSGGGYVLCLDIDGQADGNDGPVRDESTFMAGQGNPPIELGPNDGDIIWRYDLLGDLGICPHDAVSNSVLIHGDVVYLSTSNGVDDPHTSVVEPEKPAFIALDKHTGRLLAFEDVGLSRRLWHAQWSSPSRGEVNGRTLIFLGGGDGICYAFAALETIPEKPVSLEKVWSYDCVPPHYRLRDGEPIPYYEGDKRKRWSTNTNDGTFVGPSQIIATPVFRDGRVYVAIGQDPAHGRGRGMLHCIDATQTGDITLRGRIWTYDGLDRSMATAAVADGLIYVTDIAGRLHCLDAESGEPQWEYDTRMETWGGPLAADGKLYFGNKGGFFIFAQGREPELLSKIRLGVPVYSTTVAANGAAYIASSRYLWVVEK